MKRRKIAKLTVTIFVLLFIAFLFVSCSAAENSNMDMEGAAPGDGYYTSENYYSNTGTSDSETAQESIRKIVKNLQLDIEVKDVEKAYEDILKNVTELCGYEFERNMTLSGEYRVLDAVLKIPSEKLSKFSNEAEKAGNVVNNILRSEDITEQYFDAKIRIETLEKTLEKYYDFLKDAKNITEQLEITKKISDLTNEIETLKGRMNKWNNQVEYSTVNLYLRQDDDPVSIKKEIQWNSVSLDDMWYLIKKGFIGVTSFIISALQWILIVVLSISVLLIPIAILLFIIWRKKRKNKQKK